MKKLSFTLCLITMTSILLHAQFQFGPKLGLNLANCAFNFKESDWEPETKMRLAFAIGGVIDYGFSDAFSLQSGLMFSGKGFSVDLDKMSNDYETNYDGYERAILNYLELPIHAAYKIKGFQIYAGPYIAFGIGGKDKWDYSYTDMFGEKQSEKDETKLKPKMGEVKEGDLGDNESAYNGLDYGIDFGLGYQIKSILINAGYSLGLGNITPKYEGSSKDDRKNIKFSNRVITVSVSYLFGKKEKE
jgi:hypothetical protein